MSIQTIEPPRTPLENAVLLPHSSIRSNPNQPRVLFDEATLEELRESIRLHGIQQPLNVRFDPSRYDGTPYVLVAGERRWRAAEGVLEFVPCIITNVDEKVADEMALIENIQREDLAPIEEATALERLMTQHNLSNVRVAKRLGKSPGWVANRLALLKTGEDVKAVAAVAPQAMSSLLLADKIKEPETRTEILADIASGATHSEIKARVEAHESAVEAQKKADSIAQQAPDSQTQSRLVAQSRGESSSMSRGQRVTGGAKAKEARLECDRALGNLNAWLPHLSDQDFEKVRDFARRILRGDLAR